MGILDDLKKWAHPYEDEDEEYEDDFPDLRDRGDTGAFADRRSAERKAEDRRNKVVNINATTQLKVVLVKPERFENASEIADHLKEKRTVVINLESTNKDIARSLIDFLPCRRAPPSRLRAPRPRSLRSCPLTVYQVYYHTTWH